MKDRYLKRNIGMLIAGITVLVTASYFLYLNENSVHSELSKLNLIPKSEYFTELYFEKATSLPKSAIKNEIQIFSFTIHNLESKEMVYPYSAYLEYPNGTRFVLSEGYETVSMGGFRTIEVSHKYITDNYEGKIVVELINKKQKIDFLLSNK